jgi:hypothetical protein
MSYDMPRLKEESDENRRVTLPEGVMKRCGSVLLGCLCLLSVLNPGTAEVKRLDYEEFTIWLDCDRRGAVKFCYNA